MIYLNLRQPAGILLAVFSLAACLPAHLQKYRSGGAVGSSPPVPSAGDPFLERAPGHEASVPSDELSRHRSSQPQASPAKPQQATIYAVDQQTFRFQLREADVWESALSVLLRNYNLTIVDRPNGIVSTEWDTYFLEDAVYRNKVSLRIKPTSRGSVEVIIHNNVERLRDASQATGAVGAVWLPADDVANETSRLVQNMALLLNQPPPVLPPQAIAKGASSPVGGSTR